MAQNETSVHMAQGLLGKGQPRILCPKCNSDNLRKSGKSYLLGITRQKYQCKECKMCFLFPKFPRSGNTTTVHEELQVDKFPCAHCGSLKVKNKGIRRKKFRQFICRD